MEHWDGAKCLVSHAMQALLDAFPPVAGEQRGHPLRPVAMLVVGMAVAAAARVPRPNDLQVLSVRLLKRPRGVGLPVCKTLGFTRLRARKGADLRSCRHACSGLKISSGFEADTAFDVHI